MATIVYGVNGEGAGHSTRSREVISHLLARGHSVRVASFDRGLRNLADLCEVTEIYGFRFAYVNNRMRYKRTVAKNLVTAPAAVKSARGLSRLMDDWGTDLVITDFEPLTCHVAHHKRLALISIDNQHCLTNAVVTYPRKYARDAAAARMVTRLMTPHADAYLVISFFTPRVKKKDTFMFPPILRKEMLAATPTEGEHVLVYVTSPAPALARVLSRVSGAFVAYGFGSEGRDGNIVYKKPDMQGFFNDLLSAKAVIANAGFSLVSEALHLRKPYLAVPVKHQFEQVFNAYWLAKMGYGAFLEELDSARVEEFMARIPDLREKLRGYPRQGNDALFAKLDELIAGYASRSKAAGSAS